MGRRLLGTNSTIGTRTQVYLAEDAIEVDEMDGYTGTRKRVLFDEVLLITLDRRRRLSTILVCAALIFIFSFPGMLILFLTSSTKDPLPAVVLLEIMASPFLLFLIVHIALGVDYITVFGRRTTAQMTFSLRKARARAVFELLQARVAEVQDRERQRISTLASPRSSDRVGADTR